MPLTINFMDTECFVVIRRYAHPANLHIALWEENIGPIVTASVNVEFELEPNRVAIKNYSENVGVLEVLVVAGIVRDTGVRLPVGYTYANLCELLVEPE